MSVAASEKETLVWGAERIGVNVVEEEAPEVGHVGDLDVATGLGVVEFGSVETPVIEDDE